MKILKNIALKLAVIVLASQKDMALIILISKKSS